MNSNRGHSLDKHVLGHDCASFMPIDGARVALGSEDALTAPLWSGSSSCDCIGGAKIPLMMRYSLHQYFEAKIIRYSAVEHEAFLPIV
jgi:hypothetical protein